MKTFDKAVLIRVFTKWQVDYNKDPEAFNIASKLKGDTYPENCANYFAELYTKLSEKGETE